MHKICHLGLAAALLLSTPLWAAEPSENKTTTPTVVFSNRIQLVAAQSCEFILKNVNDYVTSTEAPLYVGRYDELVEMLMAHNVSEGGARGLVYFLKNILRPSDGMGTAGIAQSLETGIPALAVCVGNSACGLNLEKLGGPPNPFNPEERLADSGYVSQFSWNYSIKDFTGEATPLTAEVAKSVIQSSNYLERHDTIFIRAFDVNEEFPNTFEVNGPNLTMNLNMDSILKIMLWTGQVVRDLAKHATNDLFASWIRANLKIAAQGGQADAHFTKFVRVSKTGIVEVDKTFYLGMLHSRSSWNWGAAETHFYYKTDLKNIPQIGQHAVKTIEGHRSGGFKDFQSDVGVENVRRLRITNDGFYTWQLQITKEMLETIARAN